MNQTNILVVASSVAALLTLAVLTFSQWVAPWVPLAVGAGWAVVWAVAWVTLKSAGDVDVPDKPTDALPALVAVVLLPLVGVLWMAPPVRALVAPVALENSREAIDSVMNDSSADVRLAACASAKDIDPAHWTAIADAIAAQPDLAMQCATSLTPEFVDAVGDRWATALNRPSMTEATACMLTEKLVQIRQGKPQMLTRDLMSCADKSESEAARACCEQTFDDAIDPMTLLAAGQPTAGVLASFIRVQFRPGKKLNDELAGQLLDATCKDPGKTEVTAAYLPYVRDECAGGAETGWIEAYGTQLWSEACVEQLPYFRSERELPVDESLCRGLETAAVANAVEKAKVDVGYGRSTARSQDGVNPGMLANVAQTARERGAGTSGAGIDETLIKKYPTSASVFMGQENPVIESEEVDIEGKCRDDLNAAVGPEFDEYLEESEQDVSIKDIIGGDPCNMSEDEIERFRKSLKNKDDIDPDAEANQETLEKHLDVETLMGGPGG